MIHASMQIARPSLTIREWHFGKGLFRFWVPEDDLLFVDIRGYFHRELVPPYMAALDDWYRCARKPTIFCDWTRMERYDRESREALTRWVMQNRASVRRLELLVRSPFVAMGVSLANALLGNFMLVTSREHDFWTRLESVVLERGLGGVSLGAVRSADDQVLQVERIAVTPTEARR